MISPINIFVSYAHEDEQFLQELEKRLSLLRQQGNINLWYDQNTRAGSEWEYEINKHLDGAQIILLLVSPDFLNSNYCYSVEMQQALERHEKGKAQVIPIILRPVYWQSAPFGKLQALPKFGQPITSSKWANLDEAFFEVAEGIRKAIDKTVTMSTIPSHKQKKKFARDMKEIPNDTPLSQRNFSTRSIIRMCPCCIEEFYPGDCQIVSQVTEQILKPAPTEWLAKQYARRNPIPLSTLDYVGERACRVCPHCGYFLPYNIETVENITVAVIGDVASGKSHYITSLIHQMQERWIKENEQYIQINCLTKNIEQRYITQYLTRVFGRGEQLPCTMPAMDHLEPLIYELIFRDLSRGQTRSINLILYDGSGEDYVIGERMERFARHVFYASGIIFLVDPCTLSFVNDRLPANLKYEFKQPEGSLLLESTLQLFEKFHGPETKERLRSLPVAMMISKSDLLKYTTPIVPPYRLFSNPVYSHQVNLQDLDAVDKEVRAMFEEYKEHILLQTTQKFSNVKFMATSATGCPPESNGTYPFIDPCRCLDPLLWILDTLGAIK